MFLHVFASDFRNATHPNTATTNRMHTMAMAPAAPSDKPSGPPGDTGTTPEGPLELEASRIGEPEAPPSPEEEEPAGAVEEAGELVGPGATELNAATPVESDAPPVLLL